VSGRILGLDPGERRIGVAVADPTGTIASPVRYIDTKTESVEEAIRSLCEEHEASLIVVGLPVSLDGSEGPSARMARSVGAMAATATGLPVEYHDERFTSHTAERALLAGGVTRRKRKERRDQVAAAVMLQSFLEKRHYDEQR
jgi:putative Holliday junction resolvase